MDLKATTFMMATWYQPFLSLFCCHRQHLHLFFLEILTASVALLFMLLNTWVFPKSSSFENPHLTDAFKKLENKKEENFIEGTDMTEKKYARFKKLSRIIKIFSTH